jgi:hypothetical protein
MCATTTKPASLFRAAWDVTYVDAFGHDPENLGDKPFE